MVRPDKRRAFLKQEAGAWQGSQTPVLDLLLWLAVGLGARAVTSLTLRLLISPVRIMGEGSLGCFDSFEIPYAWGLAG